MDKALRLLQSQCRHMFRPLTQRVGIRMCGQRNKLLQTEGGHSSLARSRLLLGEKGRLNVHVENRRVNIFGESSTGCFLGKSYELAYSGLVAGAEWPEKRGRKHNLTVTWGILQ